MLAEHPGRCTRAARLDEHKEEIKESPEKPVRSTCAFVMNCCTVLANEQIIPKNREKPFTVLLIGLRNGRVSWQETGSVETNAYCMTQSRYGYRFVDRPNSVG